MNILTVISALLGGSLVLWVWLSSLAQLLLK